MSLRTSLLYSFGAGTLLGVSLLHTWLWWLVFGGVSLTLFLLSKCKTAKEAFGAGYLIGVIKMLWVLSWFWSAYPLDWFDIDPGLYQAVIFLLYWLPAALTMGLGLGLFGFLYKKLELGNKEVSWNLLLVPTLWVVAEVIGSVVFSIYTLGPGSYVSASFSFGYSGYALAEHSLLIALSKFGGVYLLSGLVGLAGFQILRTRLTYVVFTAVVLLLTAGISWSPKAIEQAERINLALIETSFNASDLSDSERHAARQKSYLSAFESALETNSDYIVFPEDSRATSYWLEPSDLFSFIESTTDNKPIVVDSNPVNHDGYSTLRANIYNSAKREVSSFDKQYLVPQGEYIPYVYQFLLGFVVSQVETVNFLQGLSYRPGLPQTQVALSEKVPPVLFCFESVNPLGVKNILRESQMPFVVHTVSHSWFKREPEFLWWQLDAMLKIQAVKNNITIVQVSNEAPTKIFRTNGTVEFPLSVAKGENWQLKTYQIN